MLEMSHYFARKKQGDDCSLKKKKKSFSQVLLWLQWRVSYLPCRFCPLMITFHAAATSGLLSAWPDILTNTPRLFTAAKQKY